MPYIPVKERIQLDPEIQKLITQIYITPNVDIYDVRDYDGHLNYCITEMLLNVLELESDPRYTKINTALGVLEGVKLELYRRLGGPYEDLAIDKTDDIGVYKRFTNWLKDKRKELRL